MFKISYLINSKNTLYLNDNKYHNNEFYYYFDYLDIYKRFYK